MYASPVRYFLDLFKLIASDAAEAWCGDRNAHGKLFKGSAYGQRHKDWLSDGDTPRRVMQHHDYRVLRQLLVEVRSNDGSRIVSSASIQELDRAHAAYVSAMEAFDARRHRQLTGRTLHLNAACDRVDRFLSKRGFAYENLTDRDFLNHCFKKIIDRLKLSGDLQECIRLSRAFCMRMEKKPGALQGDEPLRHTYGAYCALAGWWAALHSHDDAARADFVAYLRRLYSDFPDFAIQAALLWDSNGPEASFKILAMGERISESLVWGDEAPSTFGFVDAAVDAHRVGTSLTERAMELGGRTPTQLIELDREAVLINRKARSAQEVQDSVAFSWEIYSRLLIYDKRLEDAWRAIEAAQEILDTGRSDAHYLALRLRECKFNAYKLEWELSKNPESMIKLVHEFNATVKLAEDLNLSRRIEHLHEMHF